MSTTASILFVVGYAALMAVVIAAHQWYLSRRHKMGERQ